MPKQAVIAVLCDAIKKKVTHREEFLAEMDRLVVRVGLLRLIEPYCPKGGGGKMMRAYMSKHDLPGRLGRFDV